MDNHDKILTYLKENGPSHPVQVGKSIESDIFTSSAILQEMIDSKRIMRTQKKVGGSPLYYLEEQEAKARRMVEDSLSIVEKKVLGNIKKHGFVFQEELDAQSRFVMQELRDLVVALKARIGNGERIIWKYYSVDNSTIERAILSMKPTPPKEEEPTRQEKPEGIEEVIEKLGATIIKRERVKAGEVNYVIETSVPRQRYFLKHKKKKTISDSDLSLTYTEAMAMKMPAILVTSGKMTRKAMEKKKEFGDLFSVLKI
jgi:hypothetical protein